MTRTMRTFVLPCLGALLLLPASVRAQEQELARVQDGKGNHIAWIDIPELGEIQIEIATKFPSKPLAAAAFVERHDPLEVFLAVASPRRPVPEALLKRAPRPIPTDGATRRRLRQENAVELARIPAVRRGRVEATAKAVCPAYIRDFAGDVYGASSCGDPDNVFIDTTYPTDTYCNSGCEYPLGFYDKGDCHVSNALELENCDIVTGTATNIRIRTTTKGSPELSHNGLWAHFGAANCGGNGPIDFRRQRGNTVYSKSVPVGYFYHYYQGVWNVPTTAADLVSYGLWSDGLPPSGPHYLLNRGWIEDNSGTNDLAILCGDIRTRYDMSQNTCHGPNISLCYPGDCDAACWSCVGGTCN